MRLVPYESWHYEYVAGLVPYYANMDSQTIRLYAAAYLYGPGVSIRHNQEIIGCAGVLELWPGVGEAWSMFSGEMRRHPFFLHRNTTRILKGYIEDRRYHRVQSIVRENDPVAIQWIQRLGFVKESTMEKFGADGADFGMWKRVT